MDAGCGARALLLRPSGCGAVRNAPLRRLYEAHVGPAARQMAPGKPMAPHNRSLTGPMRKGAWSMKSLSRLLVVSLCIGVAAPAAARPRVPATAWPGVGDVLLNLAVDAPLATVPVVPLATWLGVEDSPVAVPAAMWCADLTLLRLSAEFRRWDGNEDETTLAPPGISVYTKTVDVPDTCDTLYVTVSATGDAHNGSQIL